MVKSVYIRKENMDKTPKVVAKQLRISDLFCGIGSMTMVGEDLGMRCVFACDNDPFVKKAYHAHFGVLPDGDIKNIKPETVPDHDILCAGFPCQPFSRMGNKRGSNEERGRVMDYAIDILRVKRPRAYILENVRGLMSSNGGEDFKRLEGMIRDAGYSFQHQMLRCEDFGIPQTRHRVFMVGFRDGHPAGFQYPKPLGKSPSLSEFLGMSFVKAMSNTVRCSGRKSGVDNAKNWSAYRLKDGTIFEYELEHVTKLQGFPADFKWGGVPESQRWKMLGNTIPTCLSKAILGAVANHLNAFPERAPEPISARAHPPPARKIIEKRLSQCEKETAMRKQKSAIAEESESSEDDEYDEDETDEEEKETKEGKKKETPTATTKRKTSAPPPVERKQCHPASYESSSESDYKPPPETKKRPLPVVIPKKEDDDDDYTQKPPPSKRPRPSTPIQPRPTPTAIGVLQLTIKSGTQITLAIPDGLLEQQCILKIVK